MRERLCSSLSTSHFVISHGCWWQTGFALALGTWPCLGADAGTGLVASRWRQAAIPSNSHTLLTLFYPCVFSFKSGKNNIPISRVLHLINCPTLCCFCSVESSAGRGAGAFQGFFQEKQTNKKIISAHKFSTAARYELFRVFQIFLKKDFLKSVLCPSVGRCKIM